MPYQRQTGEVGRLLGYLVGHPRERATHLVLVEQDLGLVDPLVTLVRHDPHPPFVTAAAMK